MALLGFGSLDVWEGLSWLRGLRIRGEEEDIREPRREDSITAGGMSEERAVISIGVAARDSSCGVWRPFTFEVGSVMKAESRVEKLSGRCRESLRLPPAVSNGKAVGSATSFRKSRSSVVALPLGADGLFLGADGLFLGARLYAVVSTIELTRELMLLGAN